MAEKEYIEKSQIIRHLTGKSIAKYPTTFITGLRAAVDEIRRFPAADVVEVVRCKDCTEWNETEGECSHWYGFRENDFCSYGERKE